MWSFDVSDLLDILSRRVAENIMDIDRIDDGDFDHVAAAYESGAVDAWAAVEKAVRDYFA